VTPDDDSRDDIRTWWPPWVRGAGNTFRRHRFITIGCATVLATAAFGATAYAKVSSDSKGPVSKVSVPVARSTPPAAPGAATTSSAAPKPSGTTAAAQSIPAATPSASAVTPRATATKKATAASKPSVSKIAASPTPPPSTPMSVSDPLTGRPFSGIPQVGAIFGFSDGSLTSHHCSGSVVSSPHGDIVVTAAHCVSGTAAGDIAFVPGYNNGSEPYGVWVASAVVVAPQWTADRNPDYDVAFLVVHNSASATPIQDVVGADTLGINQSYDALTQVVGYPSDTNQPITCTNYTTEFSATQLQFDCDGYPGGTSGSPFLTQVNSLTGLGTVVGVIGGYETGGYSPNVSYSIYFNDWVAQLLTQAESQS
jgi:hypothetical protein